MHYTVQRNYDFDTAIRLSLISSPYYGDYEERFEYYQFLSGTMPLDSPDDEPFNMYGGHQVFLSPLAQSLQELRQTSRILHINGYDMEYWNRSPCEELTDGFHSGIDIRAPMYTPVLAVGDGTIQNATVSSFELRIEDVPVFHEEEMTYVAIVRYQNARLNGVYNGQEVYAGQSIGYVTNDRSCGEGGANYLHLQILKNNSTNIDPFLLIE